MLNEIEEFMAYTTFPAYTARNKFDNTYLGRFTYDTLLEKHGLVRVFTILARGYVWEKDTPDLMRGRRALCAWCSLLTGRKGSRQDASDDWQKAPVSFGHLHDEFPTLVTENGSGWYYRHIRNIVRFSKRNEGLISQDALKHCAALDAKFKKAWADDLVRFQIPLYSPGTKAMWGLRFDDILADALLQGPLQNYEIPLSEELLAVLHDATPGRIPKEYCRRCSGTTWPTNSRTRTGWSCRWPTSTPILARLPSAAPGCHDSRRTSWNAPPTPA